jgi:hypothetical protein
MPDGRPALIGINCGERHFGDGEWARMHVNLRQEQDTVYSRLAFFLPSTGLQPPTIEPSR